ncbi:MAG TPA: 6-carboxytetrahydropterin synthase QueD [Candidatus Sulfotelmatobacter sp.]|nr:6-carboxytetrahydropterin synthase QueD [Candidatus Sulfotelmatobacter sp.]
MQIRKSFSFEAAHVLPHHPGKCARLHGHSYRLEVVLDGPLQAEGPAAGMVQDFEVIANAVRGTVLAELDHRSLNDLIENPTAERIVVWIWKRLAPLLPQLTELVLWETRSARVVLRSDDPLARG